ncbi:MOSC domain-containing protein [Mesorhizobium sp. Root157]|uniref:MOSC domain-containing protein n=1 Tax=Mesorhizobium sp. Root157 TaxID=1736477 RepID=UPI002A4E117B|nr:MOSC domain-containing protein [Mesorhizobium sp. Root157]
MAVGKVGADGDRLYGLVDAASGEIARPDTNAKWHKVPRILARLTPERKLEVLVPGGDWLSAPSKACDQAIAAYLGFDAAIRPFEQTAGQAYTGAFATARYQKAPIHLLSTASLARLKALYPAGNVDSRRFRPSVLIDMPVAAGSFPETEWMGRRIAIGSVEMTVVEPCRRCGFTIIAQEGLDYDPDILRTLVRHNRHNLGVYCRVDRPGEMAIGDAMRLLSE